MAHAIVKIHPGFQRQQCQQQQSCRIYDIPNIPNALNMSSSSSSMSFTSSDDDDDYHGGHHAVAIAITPMTPSGTGARMGMLSSPSPENVNSAATSFMSIDADAIDAIDGDYDDAETVNAVDAVDAVGVVMPLFSGAYVVATFATVSPLNDVVENITENGYKYNNEKSVNKTNKTKSTPTNPKPREEGAEICIICYEGIEEECGDFQRDFCNTCKYTVHLGCIDDYIVRKVRDAVRISRISSVGINCLTCSKEVERVILYEDDNINAGINENNNNNNHGDGSGVGAEQRRQIQLHQHALDIMQRRLHRGRRNRRKEIMCNICFMILIVLCGLAILLSFIIKK
jgi:hypothetical protein